MDNPEKLATEGTQDEDKQSKAQNNMCWTPLCLNNISSKKRRRICCLICSLDILVILISS